MKVCHIALKQSTFPPRVASVRALSLLVIQEKLYIRSSIQCLSPSFINSVKLCAVSINR